MRLVLSECHRGGRRLESREVFGASASYGLLLVVAASVALGCVAVVRRRAGASCAPSVKEAIDAPAGCERLQYVPKAMGGSRHAKDSGGGAPDTPPKTR